MTCEAQKAADKRLADTVENRDRIRDEITAISNRLAELAKEAGTFDAGIFNLIHSARDDLADARIKLNKLPFHMREENL